jgi:hypothetical protein
VQPFTASKPKPDNESGDIHLINSQRDSLNDAFNQAQTAYYSKYESVNEPAHISEYTPWLRASNFAAHLQGLVLSELADAYALPDKNDEPALFYVIQSAERTLKRLHAQLKKSADNDHPTFRVLHRQIVNTFRGNEINVDPINALQNAKSLKTYIHT